MVSSEVARFDIDLNLPESERWREVISKTKETTIKVVREAEQEFSHVPNLIRYLFTRSYSRRGGLYVEEMRSLSKELDIPLSTVTILNCAYELSHLHMPRLFGCTAGIRHVEGKGMVHVRTLDWPLKTIKEATAIFRFHKGARQFFVVGVPGQVGVLSGMVPGGYSVTINWAPPGRNPNFDYGPTFLLREVLETVDDYHTAVKVLRDTPLSTSVFFTVCGVNPGEGVVIERTQKKAVTRFVQDGAISQANHHEAAEFEANNKMVILMEDSAFMLQSGDRAKLMVSSLNECSADADPMATLKLSPINNDETVQMMMFCPKTGELTVSAN